MLETTIFSPVVQLFVIAFLLSLAVAAISLAPWFPTSKKDLERINKLTNLKDGETFYEIGCGDGRVCTYIAKHNPNVNVIGTELAFPFFMISWIRWKISGPKNLVIRFRNAFKEDFSSIDAVYLFGLDRTVNGKIKTKMLKELKPGARFISYIFHLDWSNDIVKDRPKESESAIYVYTKQKTPRE